MGEFDFKMVKEVSEIDKYIKSKVITDAFRILMQQTSDFSSFNKIFDPKWMNKKYQQMKIFDEIRILFEGLSGGRDYEGISNTQF